MIPIQDAVGRAIACPETFGSASCGRPATVGHARQRVQEGAVQSAPIRTAFMWFVVECPRCGKKLYKHGHQVNEVTT